MTKTALRVRKAILPLQGKTYASQEDLEDAVFPFFGPLIDMFTGQSHRDLVDRLITTNWAIKGPKGSFTISLPDEDYNPMPVSSPPPNPVQVSGQKVPGPASIRVSDLSFREIYALVHVGEYGDMYESESHKFSQDMQHLVSLGLMERIDMTPKRQFNNEPELRDAAMKAILAGDYKEARENLDAIDDLTDAAPKSVFVHRLTAAGKKFVDSQPDSKIK